MEERHVEEVLFPDIPAEVPGMLTQYKNLINGNDIIENKLVLDDQEQAMLVAENSGLEINPVVGLRHGEVIELLDDDDDDVVDDNINQDMITRVKEEEQEQQKSQKMTTKISRWKGLLSSLGDQRGNKLPQEDMRTMNSMVL